MAPAYTLFIPQYLNPEEAADIVKSSEINRKLFQLVKHYTEKFRGVYHLPVDEIYFSLDKIKEMLPTEQADELREGLEQLFQVCLVAKSDMRPNFKYHLRGGWFSGDPLIDKRTGKEITFEQYVDMIEEKLEEQ